MAAGTVDAPPLFNYKALESFFVPKHGDYQRTPLLAIGTLFSLVDKCQELTGLELRHVVDFGKMGSQISDLTGYWFLPDFLNQTWEAISSLPKAVTEAATNYDLAGLKKVSLCAAKAFSDGVSFLGVMVDLSVLSGLNMTKLNFFSFFTHSVYLIDSVHNGLKDENYNAKEEELNKVHNDLKPIYLEAHRWKSFLDTLDKVLTLSILVVGFCGTLTALYGTLRVVGFVASRKASLNLGLSVASVTCTIGSHLYKEQIGKIEQQGQKGEA